MKTNTQRERARGVQAYRADAGQPDVRVVLTELNEAFQSFRAANDERIEALAAGKADVVTDEKVERINADVGRLQGVVDGLNRTMAAMRVGAGAGEPTTPERATHRQAFAKWFRRGDRAVDNLGDLEVKAELRTTSDPDGGYVVPREMDAEMIRILGNMSAMRSIAQVTPMGAPKLEKLVNAGGAGGGWVGETEARTDTETPTLQKLTFEPHEMYAQPLATQTLLDDADMNIEGWLADEVGITFAELEGAAFISGDGVSKPRGLLAYDTVANASWEWGKLGYIATGHATAFPSSNPGDVIHNATYGLKRAYRTGARWLMNDATQLVARKWKDGNGVYLWQPSLQAGEPSSLNGYGIVTDDYMPDLGAGEFPIAFGDFFRTYRIIDRLGTRVLRDPYTNKPYVRFYTTKRVGGGVQNFQSCLLIKCAAS